MSEFVFSLGDFVFDKMEVPESFPWGAEQRAGIHSLIGGKKVVDAMGGCDLPIEWSGRFSGADATKRARQLVSMTKAGKALELKVGDLLFEVMILRFEPRKEGAMEIVYTIHVEVLKDLSAPEAPAGDPAVHAMVSKDMLSAQDLATEVGDSTVDACLEDAASLLGRTRAFTLSDQPAIDAILRPINDLQDRVATLVLTASDVVLGGATPLGNVVPNVSAPVLAERLLAQLGAIEQLPPLYDLDAVATRMQINLDAVGASGRTVLAGGEDLFELATQAYGNLEGWATIARANSRIDPVVPGLTELRIPPTMDNNGGVLA